MSRLWARNLVYVLTTGGTIGARVGKDGVARVEGTKDIDLLISKLPRGIEIETKELLRKGSANLAPSDWKLIASEVGQIIETRQDVKGIVILHGTDTMHYTSAALSFMLQSPRIPIVLTGSMIPRSVKNSDALSNFNAALIFAARSDVAEVTIVFSADPEGKRKVVIRGSRARKMRSIALNAFDSINVPPLAFIEKERIVLGRVKYQSRKKNSKKKFNLDEKMEMRVAYVKQNPALTKDMLSSYLRGAEGAVIEGTGRGHVKEELLEVISSFKKPVVISTQALYGGEKLGTYDIGRNMLRVRNLIEAGDMTSEAALVKLMWLLGHNSALNYVKRGFNENFCGEITL